MLMKLPVRTHGDLQLHHELLCAKEAVLCMEDTKTVSVLSLCALLVETALLVTYRVW